MDQPEAIQPPPTAEKADAPADQTAWYDLPVYLVGGFGVFILVSSLVSLAVKPGTPLITLTSSLLNFLCLAGMTYLLGVKSGKLSLAKIGFLPPRWSWTFIGIAIAITIFLLPIRGIVGLALEYLLKDPLQKRTSILLAGASFSWFGLVSSVLGVGILAPISEELYFRGLIHSWFQGRLGFWARVLATSTLFALAHYDSWVVIASAFPMGIACTIAYERTRSLWLPIAIHIFNNSFAMVLLYVVLFLNQTFNLFSS